MLTTAPDHALAVNKRSHCLIQLTCAMNEPTNTMPRSHGGTQRLLQDGHRNDRNAVFQAHLATAAAGHHAWRRGMVSLGSFVARAS